MKNKTSGVNLKWSINEKVSVLDKGTKSNPTTTNKTEYGRLNLLLNKNVKLDIKSNIKKDKVPVKKVICSIIFL